MQNPDFVIFGTSHLVTLGLILALCFLMQPFSRLVLDKGLADSVTNGFVLLIVVVMAAKTLLYRSFGIPWLALMPLQICDLCTFLVVLMLLKRSYRIYEIAYFWALGGSNMAMITPDLLVGFPDPGYIIFYIGHSLTVLGVLYAGFVFGFKPQHASVWKAIVVTLIYGVLMLGLNMLLRTNYLFLLLKPDGASLLDFMGPWPWYLIGMAVGVVIVCYLIYAPVVLMRRFAGRHRGER
ncbi:MAG: TIGR02206 family membrane protein [Gammaproteobacteria bacterium]|nr:TIGR02206 family membrane protein [Gammaproteobacteria bacterium]MDH5653719.1 TIGR02206 family membrane protein [Gammaproteobacteria bacterium]